MVKRIRKRVSKESKGPADAQENGGEDQGDLSFEQQIDALGADRVTEVIGSGVKAVVGNRGLLLGAMVAVIAIMVGVYVVQSGDDDAKATASTSFNDGAEALSAVVAPEPIDDKTPAKPLEGEARTKQLSKAFKAFESTQSLYSESPVSVLAMLGTATTQREMGKFAQAAELYGKVSADQRTTPFVKAIALQGQAVSFENAGKVPEALKTWAALGEFDKSGFGLIAGMQRGRLLEKTGKLDEAKTVYAGLRDDHKDALNLFTFRETKATLDRSLMRLGVTPDTTVKKAN